MEIKLEPTYQHVTWIINNFLELPQKDDSYIDSPEFMFNGDRYCIRVYPKANSWNGWRTEFHVLGVSVPKREVFCKNGIRFRESTGDDWYEYWTVELENIVSYRRSLIEEKRDVYVPDGSFIIVCSMRLSQDSRAGSFAQEEEDQGGFPGHNVPFSFRWSPPKMMSMEFPCTHVQLSVPKFFDLPRETCDSLTSPEFRFAGDTYCVRFRANGDTADTDLELVRLTFSIPERTVSYRVGYLRSEWHKYPKNARSLVGSTGLCITRSELEAKRKVYVQGGTLTVLLFLRLEEPSSAGDGICDAVHKRTGSEGIRKLQSDYRQLLQKGTESDACFVVCGKEFKVHKNVLRARSAVFEAMFSHDMDEKKSGRVVIDDLDPDIFGDFLVYLYTGDLQNKLSNENVFGLFAAADKYDVSTLKSKCLEHMSRTLSVQSFCDVLSLARLHSEEDLLLQSYQFFKDNLKRIIRTEKWQQFMCHNAMIANELFMKAHEPDTQ